MSDRLPGPWRRPAGTASRMAGAAVIAVLGLSALSASARAAGARPLTRTYQVQVKPLALARGLTVQARVRVTDPESKVSDWWSRQSVAMVVRKGVDGGYQRPYLSDGYRCAVVVRGEKTSFTCRLQGADVPTSVTLTFAVVYRGTTRGG